MPEHIDYEICWGEKHVVLSLIKLYWLFKKYKFNYEVTAVPSSIHISSDGHAVSEYQAVKKWKEAEYTRLVLALWSDHLCSMGR